jgi:hypothetical protein
MIGRAYVPRWYLLLLALVAAFYVVRFMTLPTPAWLVASSVGPLVLVFPVVVVRGDALVVRNIGLPRRVALQEIVGTDFEPSPWYMTKGYRLVLRLGNGSELRVNAVSHVPLFRTTARLPVHLLATVERLGLPAVEGVREPGPRR